MEIPIKVEKNVNAKTLCLYLPVGDRFTASLHDDCGKEIGGQDDGYVPSFMPGEHFGEYVDLKIDIDTGKITNWVTPTPEQLIAFISNDEEN